MSVHVTRLPARISSFFTATSSSLLLRPQTAALLRKWNAEETTTTRDERMMPAGVFDEPMAALNPAFSKPSSSPNLFRETAYRILNALQFYFIIPNALPFQRD